MGGMGGMGLIFLRILRILDHFFNFFSSFAPLFFSIFVIPVKNVPPFLFFKNEKPQNWDYEGTKGCAKVVSSNH
jgi:hypothetical protein